MDTSTYTSTPCYEAMLSHETITQSALHVLRSRGSLPLPPMEECAPHKLCDTGTLYLRELDQQPGHLQCSIL